MTAPTPAQTIPGPDPISNPLKFVLELNRINSDSMTYLHGLLDQYGSPVKVTMFGSDTVVFSGPEALQDILVKQASVFIKDSGYTDRQRGLARFVGDGLLTSTGDHWKRQRKLIQPAFHATHIRGYAETMVALTQARLDEQWEDATQLDIANEMMHITMQIVARTVLDANVDHDVERIGAAMEAINRFSSGMSLLPTWVPTPTELAARQALQTLDEIIYGLIRERRQSQNLQEATDLLSILLQSEYEDGSRMSDEQIRDEITTLILAGHETTANTLNWTWMLLSQNPDVEEKLHEELDSVLAGRAPTLADLKQLPYTEMVIKESMRLYPPAWSVGRVATEDTEVTGYAIKAGTIVVLSFAYEHRSPEHWAQPDRFWPERFSPEKEIPRYAYMPFGGGPRVCIGNSFAMMEAQLLLATIAQAYSLRLPTGHEVIPVPQITVYPKDGLPMQVRQRQAMTAQRA